MERKLLHRIFFFCLLLVSVSITSAAAGKTKNAGISTAVNTTAHHFSDDKDDSGEIEIAGLHNFNAANPRQNFKRITEVITGTVPVFSSLFIRATPVYSAAASLTRSGHLLFIFPFHYFW